MEARLAIRQPVVTGRVKPTTPPAGSERSAPANGVVPAPRPVEAASGAPETIEEPDAATASEAAPVATGNSPEETNVWPDEAAEAAFLAEARGRGESTKASAETVREAADDNGASTKALPKLDDLVQRIPPEARELLDELFRARFTAVRRVKKSELKT